MCAQGHVFWEARGLTKKDAEASVNSPEKEETLMNAHLLWSERIKTIDDAFNLAPAPESSIMTMDVGATGKQSKWDAVQEAFLRFYVSTLKVSFFLFKSLSLLLLLHSLTNT